jgi:phage replication-related protein YjqB (UPF0714/DUF867 family)
MKWLAATMRSPLCAGAREMSCCSRHTPEELSPALPNSRQQLPAATTLYLFEGIKARRNGVLHVTSHRFCEPRCLDLVSKAHTVVAVHGCRRGSRICVGGLDKDLVASLTLELVRAGYPASDRGHEFPATNPRNICNRGRRGMGAQLEISPDLRAQEHQAGIAAAVRGVLALRAVQY